MVFGRKSFIIGLKILIHLYILALHQSKNFFKSVKMVSYQINLLRLIYGYKNIIKYVTDGQRFFYTSDNPGWPSEAFDKFTKSEFKRQNITDVSEKPLQTAIISITSSCPLNCSHCFESEYINTGIQISLNRLINIINELENNGVSHIQLSGGEPLSRYDDLLELLSLKSKNIDFWLLTSGCGLTEEKAKELKKAGLTGMHISLDSYNEQEHNQFRGDKDSFENVLNAIKFCTNNGIIVSLSLTALHSFISQNNLMKYYEFAKKHNVSFIRILEPRSVGRFKNKTVELTDLQYKLIEELYLKSLSDKRYKNYPIIDYFGYHQQKVGCLGAGNRYLYIDSIGKYHSCPFCQDGIGNIDNMNLTVARKLMQEKKCHKYDLGNV